MWSLKQQQLLLLLLPSSPRAYGLYSVVTVVVVVSALLYSTYNTGEGVRGSDSNDTLKRESMEESGMVSTSVANLPQRTSRAPYIRPRPLGRGLNGMHTCCQSGRALAGPTPDDAPVGLRIFAPTARWNGRLVRVR